VIGADICAQAEAVLATCRAGRLMVATAESCTGGLIAGALTEIAGSSDVLERGFVTYSNAAKTELLGVPAGLILAEGAVSEPVARAMAEGAVAHSAADLAVAVTGIAGPGGGSADKPVGLVWFGLARRGGPSRTERHVFAGDRREVRRAAVARALALLHVAATSLGSMAGEA
jgi:nicotinamide-nucleotide amidase